MRCPTCGAAIAGGSTTCPACGAAVPAPPSAPEPFTTIDLGRLGRGDRVAGVATVVLFVSLLLPWYTTTVRHGQALSASALDPGAGGWRFLLLVASLAVLGYLFVRTMLRPTARLPLPHWQLLTVGTAVDAVLAVAAFCLRPGQAGFAGPPLPVGWGYGAWLGLAAALVAVVGSVLRRHEPEVVVPGGPHHRRAGLTPAVAAAGLGVGRGAGRLVRATWQRRPRPRRTPADVTVQMAEPDVIGRSIPTRAGADTTAVYPAVGTADSGPPCPECGGRTERGDRYCISCGARLGRPVGR